MPKRRALLLAGVTAVLAAVFIARRSTMSGGTVPPSPPPDRERKTQRPKPKPKPKA